MRTSEPVHSPWGIAFFRFCMVLLLVWVVAISLLAVKIPALDDVPVLVWVLLPLGAALFAIGGLCYQALCVRLQGDGLLPRPRHGVLALGPTRAVSISLVVGCAGTWIFVVGVVVLFVDVDSSGKTPRMWFLVVVLTLCAALAWTGYGLLRLSRFRFVADGWGLRWANPLWPSSTQLPWERIARIELRGSRLLSMRMVCITNDGRSRLVWAFDPSIPASLASYRTIFDEVVGLRQ
jgi:hypothetical protein